MKYLKTYESGFTTVAKKKIINQVNQTIDDAMLHLIDDGFDEVGVVSGGSYDIYRKYTRHKKSIGIIRLNGVVSDGEIKWSDNEYEHFDHDLIQEFIAAINIIQGISGIDLKFSFTNYYGEEKILIYAKV